MKMSNLDALKKALSLAQVRQSLIVMLIVGTILNLINQGADFFVDGKLDMIRLVLTYCIPFCVSTFGKWSAYSSRVA